MDKRLILVVQGELTFTRLAQTRLDIVPAFLPAITLRRFTEFAIGAFAAGI